MAATATTPDGGQFEGEMKDGLFHGTGKIVWADGTVYEGNFEDGHFSGKGTMQWSVGDRYTGDYKMGLAHGKGRREYADGQIYEGEFKQDRLYGTGRLTSRYSEYHGAFKEDLYWGYGSWKHKEGRRYEGGFVRGEFQGKGRFTTPTGEVYEGRFAKGELVGPGKMTALDGSTYQGEFSDWRFHGKGAYTDADGNVYEGVFTEGQLNGPGTMTGIDGSRYEGDFLNWEYHGKGVYESKEGRYEGDFLYGRFHGTGSYRYSQPREDGSSEQLGKWRYGEFVDEVAERQTKANVETALYQQPRLLDEALSALKASDPRRIDMYFLAVGGDGSQEVFRRETNYVRQQFETAYGVGGRAIQLVNSRTTVSDKPMATVTSVRKSIDAIAASMDKDNDLLFLFMTSHGTKSHDFVLDQNGMDLPDLSAKEMAGMLQGSGIKWKVLVISACYSGGFIDHLRDDYTLIITAAAHDRTSFGCKDENDFTYFGKAFFSQALPMAISFEDAFEKAKVIVTDMEKTYFADKGDGEDIKHSEPQIHKPEAIAAHLERWRRQSDSLPASP